VQDTVAICPTQVSQQAALGALEAGPDWVRDRVSSLQENRDIVRAALENGGLERVCGGEGSIYLFAKLPSKMKDKPIKSKKPQSPTDWTLAERLVLEHGVAVIPGSSCGMPDWIRVCFANLSKERCLDASLRLKNGLGAIVN
jgi:aspartate/methionine/tyrosine aminotransferase